MDESATELLAQELNSAAIHLVRRLRKADESLGVTPSRLSALSVLVFGGPRTLTELAAAEQVTGPTMSRLVAALESEGLIRRCPVAHDGRATLLEPTVAGRRLMQRGRRQRVARLSQELQQLSVAERRILADAARILRTLEASPDAKLAD